ncbi:RNA polymerase sigma factor [Arthrobacter rhizosphaerae]|uniref:RNA polymerase sigma factor n=1 Tax=Arthrobacter rhizosphaerae TaxID=2855490 RepID=UPI001FF36B5A|nr:sigma-70 family RNA polymerase sigma factor [Arthrobacter rhizosphaerae]
MHEIAQVADEDLIRSSRDGDRTALEVLYNRHHDAGLKFARRLMGNKADADDVTQEAFLKVVAAMERGNGPETAFRPYFLRAVRTAAADHWEGQAKETPTDNTGDTPVEDASLASVLHRDNPELVMKAFQSLPLRWMTVLWHAEVEREPPRKIAPILGMEPGAVSALLLRARKGLREAYLSAYVEAPLRSDCEPTFPYLAATVLGTSSARDRRKVNEHARDCEDCAKVIAQLTDVGATMRGIVAPFVLLVPVLGGARFSLQDHLPPRWTGTAAAAGVVALAAGTVAAVAVAGGLVSSGPSAAPPPHGTELSRAIPASPALPPASINTAAPTPESMPMEEQAHPGPGYSAEDLFPEPEPDTGGFPGTVRLDPWPSVRATSPRTAAGAVPARQAASPTSIPTPVTTANASPPATPTPSRTPTPTSTPTPTPAATPTPTVTSSATPTPTPTVAPHEPQPEPDCPIIFDLCFSI